MKKKQKVFFKNFHFIMFSLKNNVLNILKTDLLHELPFYNELNIEQILKAFKKYARSYKIEITHERSFDSIRSKSYIKDLFKGL